MPRTTLLLCLLCMLGACARDAGAAAAGTDATSGGEPPAATAAATPPPAPYYGDGATLLEARPGDAFTVVLPADPTGAHVWVLDPAHDHTVARLEADGELAAPPEDCQSCSLGTQSYYHFVAVGLGRLDARFRLKPDGQVAAPMTREVVIQMRVESAPHWAE